MKYLFGLILVLTFLEARAGEFKASSMKTTPGMDRSFILKTNLPQKVVLDCQSFVQGLTIGENTDRVFYLLEPVECEDMYKRIHSSFQKFQKHCIDAEDRIRADYTCS